MIQYQQKSLHNENQMVSLSFQQRDDASLVLNPLMAKQPSAQQLVTNFTHVRSTAMTSTIELTFHVSLIIGPQGVALSQNVAMPCIHMVAHFQTSLTWQHMRIHAGMHPYRTRTRGSRIHARKAQAETRNRSHALCGHARKHAHTHTYTHTPCNVLRGCKMPRV